MACSFIIVNDVRSGNTIAQFRVRSIDRPDNQQGHPYNLSEKKSQIIIKMREISNCYPLNIGCPRIAKSADNKET